jgi:hypothetical protein
LDCINGGAAWEGGSNLIVEELNGKVRVSGRRGLDKGVTIEVEFSTKFQDQDPFLNIGASRRRD